MPATMTGATLHGESRHISSMGSQSPLEPDSPTSSSTSSSNDSKDYPESTASLTGSVLNYPIENGRRYHKFREGSYMYPNDDLEMERLDLQYELLKMVFSGRRYFAPLHDPRQILDVGTGTGIWAMDMGDEFPECEVTGTDLSPIQPREVPDNVHFLIDDASEEDWLYPPNHFDYVHTRILLGSFEDFRDIIRKGFRYTKPGGWMESQEFMTTLYCDDGTMPADFPVIDWNRTIDDAAMQIGRPLRIAPKLKKWYIEAGFEDVHEQVFRLPMNPWPKDPAYKEIGRVCELNMLEGMQALSLAHLHRVMGWSRNEIEVYLINVRKALSDRRVHAYWKAYVVWGRKPDKPSPRPARPSATQPR